MLVDAEASHLPRSASGGGGAANPAVTARLFDIVTAQVPVPVQSPLHPEKVLVDTGVAVRVTAVPEL